jgi:transposase
MAKGRLSVRKIKEILRLHNSETALSNRQIAGILRISKTTVQTCLDRFKESGLNWPLPDDFSDEEVYNRLYPAVTPAPLKLLPDYEYIHKERTRPHVTLKLLWEEYRETHPDGLGRSQFYHHYQRYKKEHLSPSMRMEHKGGDKLYVDYSGDGLSYIDRGTGEVIPVELFVAVGVLPAIVMRRQPILRSSMIG